MSRVFVDQLRGKGGGREEIKGDSSMVELKKVELN